MGSDDPMLVPEPDKKSGITKRSFFRLGSIAALVSVVGLAILETIGGNIVSGLTKLPTYVTSYLSSADQQERRLTELNEKIAAYEVEAKALRKERDQAKDDVVSIRKDAQIPFTAWVDIPNRNQSFCKSRVREWAKENDVNSSSYGKTNKYQLMLTEGDVRGYVRSISVAFSNTTYMVLVGSDADSDQLADWHLRLDNEFQRYSTLDQLVSPGDIDGQQAEWVSSIGHVGLYPMTIVGTRSQIDEWAGAKELPDYFAERLPHGAQVTCRNLFEIESCTYMYPRSSVTFLLTESLAVRKENSSSTGSKNAGTSAEKPKSVGDDKYTKEITILLSADGLTRESASGRGGYFKESLFDDYMELLQASPYIESIGSAQLKTW